MHDNRDRIRAAINESIATGYTEAIPRDGIRVLDIDAVWAEMRPEDPDACVEFNIDTVWGKDSACSEGKDAWSIRLFNC